jgi:predicted HicB family RNase H-like nuclease
LESSIQVGAIDAFHGRVVGLRDVVTFQGRSLDELRREMAESVEDYLELCAGIGKKPERPYRGEFLVRTTPELHRAAATKAESAGMSLNAWVEAALSSVVKGARPPSREARKTGRNASRSKTRASSGS